MDDKLLQFLRLASELRAEYGVDGIKVWCDTSGTNSPTDPDACYVQHIDFHDVYKVEFQIAYELYESSEIISDR